MQQRPLWKKIQPGKWDTAVGGHVSYGESLMEAVYREASEELGFTEFNPVYLETYEFESAIEKEMVNIFAVVGSYDLHPDLDEVDEGRWWDLADIDAEALKNVIIAYEPVWAIGTGLTATPEQAEETCGEIRKVLAAMYGADVAETVTIQYGGSMNAKNADELVAKVNVDGGLIGGASLKAPDFATIINAAL